MPLFRLPLLCLSLFGGLVLVISACSEDADLSVPGPSPSPVEISSCRPVKVENERGQNVMGVEDMAVDHKAGRVYLSAYDRRLPLDAPAAKDRFTGGILSFPIDLLEDEPKVIGAHTIYAGSAERPVRPHGIELLTESDNRRRLFVIDRSQTKDDKARPRIVALKLSADGLTIEKTDIREGTDGLCNANNIAALGPERLFVTNDRESCFPLGRMVENVFGLRKASVEYLNGRHFQTAIDGLYYANGLERHRTATGAYELAVAQTRSKDIRFYALDDREDTAPGPMTARIALGDGPDNITKGDDGALYVAALPNLVRYAFFKAFGMKSAASVSHIYRIWQPDDLQTLQWDMIGRITSDILPGVTVAAQSGQKLLLGSAYGEGIALCHLTGRETMQ